MGDAARIGMHDLSMRVFAGVRVQVDAFWLLRTTCTYLYLDVSMIRNSLWVGGQHGSVVVVMLGARNRPTPDQSLHRESEIFSTKNKKLISHCWMNRPTCQERMNGT